MNTSVLTRTLATVPLISVEGGGVWIGTEGRGQCHVDVDVTVGEVRVNSSPHHLGQRDAFGLGDLIDTAALVRRQIDLRACGWHTAHYTAMSGLFVRGRVPQRSGTRGASRSSYASCYAKIMRISGG